MVDVRGALPSSDPLPDAKVLTLSDLRPGDVLMSRGNTNIARAIVASDGASYSHAALWSGESVIEAVLDGILERGIYMTRDVYRHRGTPDGELPTEIADKAVAFARQQVGLPYAYSEVYLLGMLYTRGIRPERPLLEAAVQALGGRSARVLGEWLETLRPQREPMVCSELVARAYYEAHPSRAYSLQVVPRNERAPLASSLQVKALSGEAVAFLPSLVDVDLEQLAAFSASCTKLITNAVHAQESERKVLFGAVAYRAGTSTPLGHVTPGDLQFSPTLTFVGRVLVETAN